MHATEREQRILHLLSERGFISFQELERGLDASPATLRRDLERMASQGLLTRVRGGARLPNSAATATASTKLTGVPFHENIGRNRAAKEAIGKAAAELCRPGEAVMIDGGSTTLQMCPHLSGLNLQVLTNSLHIVSALLPQIGTRILVPSGMVFREQNIILAASGEKSMPSFHAHKLFMSAAAVGPEGPMQADVILVTAERSLIDRADEIVLLVDSSKFAASSGHVVCPLDDVDLIVTDAGISDAARKFVQRAGVRLIVAQGAKAH